MSSLNRLFGLAAKALDSSGSSNGKPGGGTDWRSMVRDVAGAVTGDQRPAAAPPASAPWPPAPVASAAAAPVGLTPPPASSAPGATTASGSAPATAADRAAIARYEYLLQTSDPHQVEAIHREAFARLTPEQRAQVQAGMRSELRPGEQPRSAEAPDLARAAARTEAMRPGAMAGLLARVGRRGRGASAGGGMARNAALVGVGGMLGAVAGAAVVSTVAVPLLAQAATMGVDFDAIAGSLDLEAIAGGVDLGGAGDLVSGASEQLAGAGEAVTGLGEQLSNFELPGLGDLFR
ncbi:cation-transporting ATPase [Microbacterium sp. NPDC056569]|uniref:cation-transporting ATPase n=1 Tax=Microbacterium sp. NPDC056569 TaxID=3345867 RepID=UPI00366B27A4